MAVQFIKRYSKPPEVSVGGWRAKRTRKAPDLATVDRWIDEGVARATDGCKVAPEGSCAHGKPSWAVKYGVVAGSARLTT